jgi:hypothetical protein
MWLFSILLFFSNSNQDPSFLTLGPNYAVDLSPEAEDVMRDVPFVILTSGDVGSDSSFVANTLLDGLEPSVSADRFFHTHDTDHRALFPFHGGIKFDTFCVRWKIECGVHQQTSSVVFIDSGTFRGWEAADSDLLRGIVSLSPLLLFRIHLAPRVGENESDWWTMLSQTGAQAMMADSYIPYGVVIGVPRIDDPGITEDPASPKSEGEAAAAGARQDRNLTEELWRYSSWTWREMDRSAVFELPNPIRSPMAYRETMRDIARLIVRRSLAVEPWQWDDLRDVFGAVTERLEEKGKYSPDFVFVDLFVNKVANGRISGLRDSIMNEYWDNASRRLREGYRALEVNTKGEAALLAKKAMADFILRYKMVSPRMRRLIRPKEVEQETLKLERTLVSELSELVARRRKQEEGFHADSRSSDVTSGWIPGWNCWAF